MVKKSSGTQSWYIGDNKRLGYNPQSLMLRPNTADVEVVVTVVVVWMVVELDIDGDTVANTTFLSTNITLELGGFGEGGTGGEGGAMNSRSSALPGKITWPLLALSILVITYAIAAISIRRNDIRGIDDGSLQGPYSEAE